MIWLEVSAGAALVLVSTNEIMRHGKRRLRRRIDTELSHPPPYDWQDDDPT
jgi:hypothetical protein